MMRPEDLERDQTTQQSGWVPKLGRGFPQLKVSRGWDPGGGQPDLMVGTGADDDNANGINPSLTPDEERRRLQQRFGWDPGQRLQQLGQQWQQNPVMGAVSTVGLPFEALGAATHYAGGVIQGAEQAIPEAIAGRQLEGDVRNVDQGPFGVKTLPRVQNILDPAEASARYDAVMNPVASFGADLLAGGGPAKLGMKAAGAAAGWAAPGAARLAQAIPGVADAANAVGPVLDRTMMPLVNPARAGFMGQVGDAMNSSVVQKGIGLGLPVAAGVSTALQQNPDDSPEQKAFNVGTAALAGFGAGQTLTLGLRAVGQGFSKASLVYEHTGTAPADQAPYTPLEARFRGIQGAAERAGAGGSYDPAIAPQYPGGYAGLVWDSVRAELTDRVSVAQSYASRVEKDIGRPLLPDENPYVQLRLQAGVDGKIQSLLRTVGPELDHYGVTARALGAYSDNDSAMSDFDALRLAWKTVERLSTVNGGQRMLTGPAFSKVSEAREALRDTAQRVNKYYATDKVPDQPLQFDMYGAPILTGMSKNWIDGANAVTTVGNYALKIAHEAGMLSDDDLAAYQKQTVYGALRVTEDSPNQPGIQSISLLHQGLAVTTDFGTEHGTTRASTLNLKDDLSHIARVVTLAQQNQAGRSFENLRALSPDFAENVMRDTNPRNGKPIAANTEPPAGWSLVPVFRNVDDAGMPLDHAEKKFYIMASPLADSLTTATKAQADLTTGFMAKMVAPFHLGITSLSLPFLVHNPAKDTQTMTQNYLGGTGPLWRNAVGAWFEAITGQTGLSLDQWVQQHQNDPRVQGLGGQIWGSLENFFLGKQGRQLSSYQWAGGGSERLISQYQGPQDVVKAANLPGAPTTGARKVIESLPGGTLLTGAHDLVLAAATIGETASRLAVFRAAKEAMSKDLSNGPVSMNNINQAAAMTSRDALVDFSKGGNTMRLASVWLPLLNARAQGTLASWESAKDDPQKFLAQSAALAAVPTIMTYANNRLMFGDLYDKISQDEKDKNHILIYGSYANDRGEELPLRLKIPKNDVSALISTPLEHFLDTKFHVENHGMPLTGDQRTEQSMGQVMLGRLASLLPINLSSNSSLDPGSLMMSTIAMNPIVGTATQMWANRDAWQGQPIIPDDKMMLPPQYQYDERTPALTKALSALLHSAGAPQELQAYLAPARTAFMVRGLGGTAAQQLLGMGDVAVDALNKGADAAGYPRIEFNPKTLQDLGAPPGADPEFWQPQIDSLERQDMRPWYVKAPILSALLGTTGGAQTILAKVEQSLPPRDQEVWRQTRTLMQEYQVAKQKIDRETTDMYGAAAAGELTPAEVQAKRSILGGAAQGAMVGLNAKYPLALVKPQDRQAFIDKLPGVPVAAALAQARSDLPSGLDVDTLVQRYSNPDTDPALGGLGPLARQQAKSLELQQLSNQFQVPISVLRDYIATAVAGRSLPAIGISDVALEKTINDYRTPIDPRTGKIVDLSDINGQNLGILRRDVITKASQDYGVPEDQLLQRVQARLLSPDEQHPIAQSMERAFAISAEVHDPNKFPAYVDRSGNPLGTEDESRYWDQILESAKGNKPLQHSQLIRDLQTAKDSAQVRKLSFLFAQPDYQDYARWFGLGRNMTFPQWEGLMSGSVSKYKDNPDPNVSLQRDAFIQLWQAMPPHTPEKQAMTPTAHKYEHLAQKNWRSALLLDAAQWEEANYGQSTRSGGTA